MRTVAEHLNTCLALVAPLDPLDVLLPDAVGCVLAEDVSAPFDLPVTDQATLDGYAVRSQDVGGAGKMRQVYLDVIAEVKAGDAEPCSLVENAAVRIASGAPLPMGADTVVPLEETDQGSARVQILSAPAKGKNILRRRQDVSAGTTILRAGTRIGSRQVALLAGVGRLRVRVRPRPRVVILSIGDELIEPGKAVRAGAVFDANGHALSSAVADARADTFRVAAVPDEQNALSETIEDQLVRADIIITAGGLSYGSGDTVKEVLAPLGTARFDMVAMTPGKQLGYGTVGEGTPIFCLPGNPVAAQICYEIFVRPCLRHMAGWQELYRPSLRARVDCGWRSPAGRRQFVPVKIVGAPDSGYRARLTGKPEDLLLSSMASANALAVIPEAVTAVSEGDYFHCMVLD